MKTRCHDCKRFSENVRLREKTRADWTVERLALCTPCARKGGWIDVTFDRGYHLSLGSPGGSVVRQERNA